MPYGLLVVLPIALLACCWWHKPSGAQEPVPKPAYEPAVSPKGRPVGMPVQWRYNAPLRVTKAAARRAAYSPKRTMVRWFISTMTAVRASAD